MADHTAPRGQGPRRASAAPGPYTIAAVLRAGGRAHNVTDRRPGARPPRRRDAPGPRTASPLTVREAGPEDHDAALALHRRCSRRTLAMRYQGPPDEADGYLRHLLSPHFGRTLAVQTAGGRLVALGHLLWDDDEAELALLVEDAWQRRGLGTDLLRRLLTTAAGMGYGSVYVVTRSLDAAMDATLRKAGVPLEYQVEGATLVVTARLDERLTSAAGPAGPR
ncbi:GNAT family N-acetyltransferase [Streptomyces sp. NBC_01808]|uniref:GNAT family N-acetyltransferase n=1 Tax=Streptomyces sp. NBC_01808 TaxID=2975947 RepID=UPI003FA34FA6